MKVEKLDIIETKKVMWKDFQIFEGRRNDRLIITGPEFRVTIWKGGADIKYTFHRPDHDHNNSPSVTLDIPKEGARGDNDAILTVHSDSGFYPSLFLSWGYGKKQELKPIRSCT